MSVMVCPRCDRYVDTDYEPGEEIEGHWMCERCAELTWMEEDEKEAQYIAQQKDGKP